MKKLICLLLSLVILSSCCACYLGVFAFNEEEMVNNRPKYSITSNFDDETILILLTSNASKSNPEFTPEDFGDLGVAKIERKSKDGAQNHCFVMTLDRQCKQNVLDVIYELHKNKDILSAEPNYQAYIPEYDVPDNAAEQFISYVVDTCEFEITEEDVRIEYMYTFSQDKYLVRYFYGLDYPQFEVNKQIGDYELKLGSPPLPIVYTNGTIYELEQAYESGTITDADLETMTKFRQVDFERLLFGDADSDGELSILDATLIQMHIAGLVDKSQINLSLCDMDGDGDVSVMDATAIQLKLAGIE